MQQGSFSTRMTATGILLIGGVLSLTTLLHSCGAESTKTTTITADPPPTTAPVKVSFMAYFYDNYGAPWFNIEGSHFNITPNKVKEYSYNSNGIWNSSYTMSSVLSIDIDGKAVESCGSTVLFADTRLKQYPIAIPEEVDITTNSTQASISTPRDLRFKDYWTINRWWVTKDAYDYNGGAKIVVIQSQEGQPICMYAGNNVTWEVSRNLPKTTEITIDDMKLYIHRANFAILDKALFN